MSPATPTTVATPLLDTPVAGVEDREPQRLSDRRLSGPEPSRERLADNDHRRCPGRVGRREVPAGDDGNAERREVAGVDDVPRRREHLRRAGWSPGATPPRPMPSKPPGGTRASDALSTAGICRTRSITVRQNAAGPAFGSPGHRRVERRDVDASRVETGIGGAGMAQDADERRAEHDEQDTTRDLADDEGAPEPRASGR